MLVAAARESTSRGYASLRFDFRGRGDSGGATMAATLTTMIEDTLAAASLPSRRARARSPSSSSGDCSGCEVAIGAAPSLADVRALALWSAPIIGGAREVLRCAKSRAVRASYARKLFSAQSWRKLLTRRPPLGPHPPRLDLVVEGRG